jgi:hypothetical protein
LEKKGTSKRGKQGKKMELSICICFAFILLFRFTFLLLFFLLLAWKKGKTHANRKNKINAQKNMQMDNSIVSPFFVFPCFSLFLALILLLCFLDFADLFFFIFFCVSFFSS